jgi:multidrug efflux pump subunit AcrB
VALWWDYFGAHRGFYSDVIFSGATGIIYRQFSITLVAAMALSLMVALILTPALCAVLLKPQNKQYRWAQWFNRSLDKLKNHYLTLSKNPLILNIFLVLLLSS